MKQAFLLFWCVAGLITLDAVLRSPRTAPPADTASLVTRIRTTCELPPGTLVFVATDADGAP